MVTGANVNMLRILSWNSTTGFEKMPSHDDPSLASNCMSSGFSGANLSGKRKRSFAVDKPSMMTSLKKEPPVVLPATPDISSQLVPRSDTLSAVQPLPVQSVEPAQPAPAAEQDVCTKTTLMSNSAQVKSKEEAQLATMRQTISSQLSLEILMKHKELRLIDQELAKCQVALEQLRRCSEIPYPALQRPSEQVTTGLGAAVRKSTSKTQARSPAPWGVVEGPYSRHYAKWLLSDPYFDGGEPELLTPIAAGMTPNHGRSTRGVFTDFAQMVGKTSRSQRALHQGLPAGFVEPKQKPTGPMILKRKSDGKMVKLVCPDCARFDFGSAQGFINHCRIGHQRNFASHDAAAEGCGQLLDGDENVQPKESSAECVPTPVATTPITPNAPVPLSSTPSNIVHNLVRSAHLVPKSNLGQPLVPGGYVPKSERKSTNTEIDIIPAQCTQTPNLSALVRKQGLDLDLKSAVEDAKAKDCLYDESDWDHETEIDTPLPTPNGNSRHPTTAGKKPGTKSIESNNGVRRPSFVQATDKSYSAIDTTSREHDYHGFLPLLPSPTNDSTQAPSLIDDDEEMDAGSPPSSDEHDDTDVPVHVRDDEHPEDAHEMSRTEIPSPTGTCGNVNTAEQANMSRPANYGRPPATKQYNFIAEKPMSADHGDKKRRRIAD